MEVDEIVAMVLERLHQTKKVIPVGVSNRHIHLSELSANTLFGIGYIFNKMKDLSQPGQYACEETVTIIGPKGIIEKVRILGPLRKSTQIELLHADCRRLGIPAVIRESGKLDGTPELTLCGPEGCIKEKRGAIVAKRHLHMNLSDATSFGCCDGENVMISCDGERGGTLNEVTVRVSTISKLEFHVDFDEANALGLNDGDCVMLFKK